MSHFIRWPSACRAVALAAAVLLAPLGAAAQFLNPLSTQVGIDASAINGSGVSRHANGNGPIADSAAELSGLNFATAAASVDAAGLHMTATVHGDSTNAFGTATARAFGGLVDPFILVPRAGFTGTQALLRIPYSFAGTVNHLPSLAACSTCFAAVQADLGVDGMTDQFHFLGASSQGTMTNPTFFVGGVARGGILEGLVPVNTELYLRAGLLTQVHCQSDTAQSCGSEALFGGTLSFSGFSTDAVDIVWGLTPAVVAAVPEPSTWLLMVAGLAAMTRLQQRRHS